jgi:hypothetical protein
MPAMFSVFQFGQHLAFREYVLPTPGWQQAKADVKVLQLAAG